MNLLRRWSRRDLLRAAAGGAALAPLLPRLPARASGATAPRRLLFFYTSNGTVRERWLPTMNDGGLVLSEILAPLERHRDRLLVIDGLDYKSGIKVRGGHEGGMNAALTASVPRAVDAAGNKTRATSISIDQAVARIAGRGLKFPSLELGVQVDTYDAAVYALSYTGPLKPLMPENDPYRVYGRVFGSLRLPGHRPDQVTARLLRTRASVIDAVKGDLAGLARRLGADERVKLDAHLEGVRSIERALTAGPGPRSGRDCRAPVQGTRIDVRDNDEIPRVARLQTDLMLAALACDLVRVGTIQHGRAGANHRLSWLGREFMDDPAFVAGKDETKGIHSLAHSESRPESRARIARCQAWYASEVATLLDRLATIDDGDGSLADGTLVVWMNEMGTGSHKLTNTPWVLAGGLRGHLKTGRLLEFPRRPHNALLLSLAHLMGLEGLSSFGAPEFCDGPLSGLAG